MHITSFIAGIGTGLILAAFVGIVVGLWLIEKWERE